MRGVVLSEIAEIEVMMRNRLLSEIGGLDESQQQSIKEGYIKSKNSQLRKSEEFIKKLTDDLSVVDFFDDEIAANFDLVRQNLRKITSNDTLKNLLSDNELIHTFQKERNTMAHDRSEIDQNTGMMKFPKKGREYSITSFENLRKNALAIVESINEHSESRV